MLCIELRKGILHFTEIVLRFSDILKLISIWPLHILYYHHQMMKILLVLLIEDQIILEDNLLIFQAQA